MSTTRTKNAKPRAGETKALPSLEVKDEARGQVEAVIATLGVVDHDEDIIRPSAIKSGSKVKVSAYGHDAVFGAAPVGKGAIHIEGDKAIFRGQFFLRTQRGRESFETVKALGADGEWSFGYIVVGSEMPSEEERKRGARRILTKLDAFEVSPVLRGAGIGTGTVSAKSDEEVARHPGVTREELEIMVVRIKHRQRDLAVWEHLGARRSNDTTDDDTRSVADIADALRDRPYVSDSKRDIAMEALKFGAARLGISYLEPRVKFVGFFGQGDNRTGEFYHLEPTTVRIRADVPDDDVARIVFHELGHMKDYDMGGFTLTEEFAESCEKRLLKAWNEEAETKNGRSRPRWYDSYGF